MKKQNLKLIANQGNAQLVVELFPKDSHYKFDCIRIRLTDFEGNLKMVDMTPDESLELASLLANANQYYLMMSREYANFIKSEKKKHGKSTSVKLVKIK